MAAKFVTATAVVLLVTLGFLLCFRAPRAPLLWLAPTFGALAIVIATFCVLKHGPSRPADVITGIALGVFVCLLLLPFARCITWGDDSSVHVKSGTTVGQSHSRLFVLVHGFAPESDPWSAVRPALEAQGDILELTYRADLGSNADPATVARKIALRIRESAGEHTSVTLIGHSVGSLLIRSAYLKGIAHDHAWWRRVDKIVLLAGTNRGWNSRGKKPLDMSPGMRLAFAAGVWFGRLTRTGEFILKAEAGSPFVANLRVNWLKRFRVSGVTHPRVVQLLGDQENMVSDDDNRDVMTSVASGTASSSGGFYWLRVRGTGHMNILHFREQENASDESARIGPYRRAKFELAIGNDVGRLERETEVRSFVADPRITDLVFIVHGIRDLGEWSAPMETQIRATFEADSAVLASRLPPANNARYLAIESPRYGYFSMGEFVLQPNRDVYVRWLMDEMTEALAKYPNVSRISIFGHSNGTYLLGTALQRYSSVKVDALALAASVLPTTFPWKTVRNVKSVRNYYSRKDVVVGIFPKLFETPPFRWMKNRVGGAGNNGFNQGGVTDRQMSGGHGEFQNHIPAIARYLVAGGPGYTDPMDSTTGPDAKVGRLTIPALALLIVAWIAIPAALIFAGVRVASAGSEYAWVPVLLYLGLVVFILKRL